MVKRYGTSCTEHPEGIYVLHKDYEALERERDALREIARKQFYELEGVVIDTERGHGFDETCLNTIKRVQAELAAMSKEKA